MGRKRNDNIHVLSRCFDIRSKYHVNRDKSLNIATLKDMHPANITR